MAKKKKSKKRVKIKPLKAWFKTLSPKHKWGFVPVSWEGVVALFILISLNVFAGNYFDIRYLIFDNWSKFGVVFLLSMFVFIEISRKRTEEGKYGKKK